MEFLFWSILFCVVMVILMIVEALTVTMGLFTTMAVTSAIISVYMGFRASESVGYVMLAANTVLFPLSLYLVLTYLRRSPMTLDSEVKAGVPKEKKNVKPPDELMGQEGVALTYLRPSGTAQFGERRVDVVTDGKFVEAGTKVRVLKVNGFVVLVEPTEALPTAPRPERDDQAEGRGI
jgi:membrane-bound serine protease (ClpP class)